MLREALREWTDWDVAAFALAVNLGLMEPGSAAFGRAKHVFWSDHAIGILLHDMLNRMAEAGILERRDEPDIQFRWSVEFVGSWAIPWTGGGRIGDTGPHDAPG